MAHYLPFSISNILRSDFPRPSHIIKPPRVLCVEPLGESGEAPFTSFQPCQQVHGCNQTNVCIRGCLCSTQTIEKNAFPVFQISGLQATNRSPEEPKEDPNISRKTPTDTEQDHMATEQNSAGKTKRRRTHFTRRQLAYLQDVFSRQKYLTRDERALLASVLHMTELQIRNWFQNRRYQLRLNQRLNPKGLVNR